MPRVDPQQLNELLSEGLSNPQAGQMLGLRPSTVGKWRRRLVQEGALDPQYASSSGMRAMSEPGGYAFNGANRVIPDAPDAPDALDGPDAPDDDGLADIEHVDDADDVFDVGSGITSPTIEGAKDRAASKILEVREARAEFELAQLRQRIAQIEHPEPTPAIPAPGADPMVQMMMAQLSDARAQSQMLMGHMLKLAAPGQAAPANSGMLETVKTLGGLLEFVDGIRGNNEAAPADPLTSMMNLASKALEGNRTIAPMPGQPAPALPPPTDPGAAQQERNGQASAQTFNPEEEGRKRATAWFAALIRELSMGSDPVSVAEALTEPLGLLPTELRSGITSQTSMETLVPIIGRFIPAEATDQLVSLVRSSEVNATWVGTFLRETREIQNVIVSERENPTPNPNPHEVSRNGNEQR